MQLDQALAHIDGLLDLDPAVAHAICEATDPVAAFAADTTLWGEMASRPELVDTLRKAYARVLAFVAQRTGA